MKVNRINDKKICVCGHEGWKHKWKNQITGEWYYGNLCMGGNCSKCGQMITCNCEEFIIKKQKVKK